MEEEKTEGFINTPEELDSQIDNRQLRTMTITIKKTRSSLIIACSKCIDDFRNYISDLNIYDLFKNLWNIMDGSL